MKDFKLRCEICPFAVRIGSKEVSCVVGCNKLNHRLNNGYAVLAHGGELGNPEYPAKCGVLDSELLKKQNKQYR